MYWNKILIAKIQNYFSICLLIKRVKCMFIAKNVYLWKKVVLICFLFFVIVLELFLRVLLYFIIVFLFILFMYNSRIGNFARENSTSFFDSLKVWGVINGKTLNVDTLTRRVKICVRKHRVHVVVRLTGKQNLVQKQNCIYEGIAKRLNL